MTETTTSERPIMFVYNLPCDANTPFRILSILSRISLAILHVDQTATVHALADIGHVGGAVYEVQLVKTTMNNLSTLDKMQ